MTTADIALLFGVLVSCWSIGFAAGYCLTKFKDAMSTAVS